MMAGGRPTKYCKELVKKSELYLTDFEFDGSVIPSIEGLSEYLDIGRQTIYRWKEDEEKEEFRYILEKILAKQAKLLINSGLKGDFNAAITKLALGKHGYHDKVDSSVSVENPLTVVIREISGNTLGPTSD